DNLLATDGDDYLVGLSYPGATIWVNASGNHCGGGSNGVFSSGLQLSALGAGWVKSGLPATAPPTAPLPCADLTSTGRLGQQDAMVPPGAVSVSVCTGTAAE